MERDGQYRWQENNTSHGKDMKKEIEDDDDDDY